MIRRDGGRLDKDIVEMETMVDQLATVYSISNADLDMLRAARVQDVGSDWLAEMFEWIPCHPVLELLLKLTWSGF